LRQLRRFHHVINSDKVFGTHRYDTLASVEALATVIVIVLVAAGAITLAESRRR
jgi:hypothetical protein